MARSVNKFIDPATATEYEWPINHDTEEAYGEDRSLTPSANTANVGLVLQQGDKQPTALRYAGKILTREHLQYMWAWFRLCDDQTIHFEDYDGNVYEVIIASFHPIRKRVENNMRGGEDARLHIWEYTIEMTVVRYVSGYLEDLVVP